MDVARQTGIDPWFLDKLQNIVAHGAPAAGRAADAGPAARGQAARLLRRQIGTLADRLPEQVRDAARRVGHPPGLQDGRHLRRRVRGRDAVLLRHLRAENEATAAWPGARLVVIGSGPIRIGQGIEFDYCSRARRVGAAGRAGVRVIMINSNPETVTTDFDTSDRLYFEPLDEESVRDILENEAGADGGEPPPAIVAVRRPDGDQPGRAAAQRAALPILGSSSATIDLAEDRHLFERVPAAPRHPAAARRRRCCTLEEAIATAQAIGYPVLVRPVVRARRAGDGDRAERDGARDASSQRRPRSAHGKPILIDKYLEGTRSRSTPSATARTC